MKRWEAERQAAEAGYGARLDRPFRERGIFGLVDEIAPVIAREAGLRPEEVVMQLVKWARQGEMGFELRINNPPYFMPFDASDRPNFPANDCELILHNAQILYLSRAATECASSIMICRSRKCGLRSTTRPRLVPAGLLCLDDFQQASKDRIHIAITAVYDEKECSSEKPPNIRELPKLVQAKLAAIGCTASGALIMEIGNRPEHKKRRLKPGKTIASEKRMA